MEKIRQKWFINLMLTAFLSSFTAFVDGYSRGKNNVPVADSRLTEDDALFLTPYIENGQIEKGQNLAKVPPMLKNVNSFSGYLTVNKSTDSNLFSWFFKSQQGDWKKKPLVVWLQGGPGASSMFGLFTELGPFFVTKNQKLKRRKYSWHRKYNLVFIDNPVGAGFSFTKKDSGYARDETDVARDLYEALVQLHKLFPTLQRNKLFITGESYAGKYIPAIGHKIYQENKVSNFKINLAGLMIGNGWTDPVHIVDQSAFLYRLGLIDSMTRDDFQRKEDEIRDNIRSGQYMLANELREEKWRRIKQITGLKNLFDFVNDSVGDFRPVIKFMNDSKIRKVIHVGNCAFNNGDKTFENLKADLMQSVKLLVEKLLAAKEFPILFFTGQLDILVTHALSVAFYDSLEWPCASEYHKAKRCQFKVGAEIAGYYKTAGTFTEVMVRNTGHMVPTMQQKWAFALMDRFIINSSSFVC
nr:PREDICTED: venom serine carboxypeptidase-like [Bemisia tabaci]